MPIFSIHCRFNFFIPVLFLCMFQLLLSLYFFLTVYNVFMVDTHIRFLYIYYSLCTYVAQMHEIWLLYFIIIIYVCDTGHYTHIRTQLDLNEMKKKSSCSLNTIVYLCCCCCTTIKFDVVCTSIRRRRKKSPIHHFYATLFAKFYKIISHIVKLYS